MYMIQVDSRDGTQMFFSENCLIAMLLSCGTLAKVESAAESIEIMDRMEQAGEIRSSVYKDGELISPDEMDAHLDSSPKVPPEYTLAVASREQRDGELPYHVVRYVFEGPTLGTIFDWFYEIASVGMDVEPHKLGALVSQLEQSGQLRHIVTHNSRVLGEEEVFSLLRLEKETGGHA